MITSRRPQVCQNERDAMEDIGLPMLDECVENDPHVSTATSWCHREARNASGRRRSRKVAGIAQWWAEQEAHHSEQRQQQIDRSVADFKRRDEIKRQSSDAAVAAINSGRPKTNRTPEKDVHVLAGAERLGRQPVEHRLVDLDCDEATLNCAHASSHAVTGPDSTLCTASSVGSDGMCEASVVHKVAEILDKGPAVTPQMRARIEQLLADREVSGPD
ncbi:hypothetical protein [Mycobacterium sp. AZCC_0083]|uniref:hypothetical protein n=1 Tax=Mycobacterium sp. AZCC_0083 TaxID=2735882 RepID=UPI001609154A|nr:hypothetical protein [Mycobacterium sp. AZCC_0083]MBB5161594.1 hypothetical protein [Mycobacterium sp. AZCC_0083]